MSRAFVSDKEDWAYCPKAGERCLHATEGRDCTRKDCPHSSKVAPEGKQSSADQTTGSREQSSLRVVRRQPKEKSASASEADRPSKTKRANIRIPRPWGGRSGSR